MPSAPLPSMPVPSAPAAQLSFRGWAHRNVLVSEDGCSVQCRRRDVYGTWGTAVSGQVMVPGVLHEIHVDQTDQRRGGEVGRGHVKCVDETRDG